MKEIVKTTFELNALLPEVEDSSDEYVERLIMTLQGKEGIDLVHKKENNGKPLICFHFNPQKISINQIESIAKASGAELQKKFGHKIFRIDKIDSEDAGRRIENEVKSLDGVINASMNHPSQSLRVEWDKKKVTLPDLEELLEEGEYIVPFPFEKSFYQKNKELIQSIVCGLLLAIGWIGEYFFNLTSYVAIPIYIVAYFFGAWDLVSHNLTKIFNKKFTFNIDLLMLLAAIGAGILGEWAEGALLLFLFSLAHALEHYALDKARNAIRALNDLSPPKAIVLREGKQVHVLVENVKSGETVIVLPSERVPVDGKVTSGNSSVNQAPITGESVPVEKKVGDDVFAGTVNGDGMLEVKTEKSQGDRVLDRIIKLVEEAQTQKAPTELFTQKFEKIFVPAILVFTALLVATPPIAGLLTLAESFYRGMALLVGASPCALALGTPSAVLAGIAQAARNGVLIKGGAYLENLGAVNAFAFDKTGTLTVGKPEVLDVVPGEGGSPEELLSVGAAVEKKSQHPLARAVVNKAEEMKLNIPNSGDLQSLTAKGVRSEVNGKVVEIGSLKLWQSANVSIPESISKIVKDLQEKGRSIIVVKQGEKWLGVLGIRDNPRPGVKDALNKLRSLGLKHLIMLTGDNAGIGNAVGKEVGVDEVKADLLPEDKVKFIGELNQKYQKVAMVGDGVNDAPALAHATVGIAMGGAGTAVALETADVALMGDDIQKLPFVVGLSRAAKRVIKTNLYISLSVIALLVVSATIGSFGIGSAILVHEGSTMVVIVNSLILLRYKD